MTATLLFLCIGFGVSLAVGQILFKIAALGIRPSEGVFITPALFFAIVLYGLTTILWIFILTRLPLNIAYPFSLLGSAFVPFLAHYYLGEAVGIQTIVGLGLVLCGLLVMHAL